MSKVYYKLTFDDSNSQAIVCRRYDLNGVNKYVVSKGELLTEWPNDVTFYYDSGYPEDYLGNSLGWLLFSQQVKNLFISLRSEVQFLPVKVINEETRAELQGYSVANVLRKIPALDWGHSKYQKNKKYPEFPTILRVALLDEAIASVNIFRLEEQPALIFVAKELKLGIEKNRCTGFRFVPTPVY